MAVAARRMPGLRQGRAIKLLQIGAVKRPVSPTNKVQNLLQGVRMGLVWVRLSKVLSKARDPVCACMP